MNDIETIQQFAVGAVTIAANRSAAVRAEVLKVGDPVRILIKPDYGEPEVHTGVIVGFEPFTERPTIIIAYLKVAYSSVEMKMLYYTGGDKQKEKAEILSAPEDINIDIERSRVLDWFNAEEAKKLAEIDDIRSKRRYFNRYFDNIMSAIPGGSVGLNAMSAEDTDEDKAIDA